MTDIARPRRSKALPLSITALILFTVPLLLLPVMFAVADPYLTVPVLGLLDIISVAFGITAVIVGIRSRTATIPRRFGVLGAVLGGIAVVLAGQRTLHTFSFLTSLAGS